jgi:hypothetical protein
MAYLKPGDYDAFHLIVDKMSTPILSIREGIPDPNDTKSNNEKIVVKEPPDVTE